MIPEQPPIDNNFVAPGCELFASVPPPARFVPDYGDGLETIAYGLGDDAGPQYHVRMKQNGCFVAMTRSLVDAQLVEAAPDVLHALIALVAVEDDIASTLSIAGHRDTLDAALARARSAIFKATAAPSNNVISDSHENPRKP